MSERGLLGEPSYATALAKAAVPAQTAYDGAGCCKLLLLLLLQLLAEPSKLYETLISTNNCLNVKAKGITKGTP